MKIISKSIGHLSNIERYDMCDVFSESAKNKGLIACYALAAYEKSKFISLDLRAEHEEIGVPQKWHRKYSGESFFYVFNNLEQFLKEYDSEDFGQWTLSLLYQNIEVVISGKREKTEVGVSYPKDEKLNLLPLFSEVENASYKFNCYDEQVINMLKSEYRMNDKRAVLTIQKLLTQKDIFDEFVLVITSGQYANSSSAVVVEGFSAEMLNANYPLSVLGAYNYLIYLRESPKEALEDLRKGLPRK